MQRSGASPGSGTLYKLSVSGFRGRAWAKRHFVFSGQTLAYYTSLEAYERQERPRKVVDLTNCRVEDTGMERWTSKARQGAGRKAQGGGLALPCTAQASAAAACHAAVRLPCSLGSLLYPRSLPAGARAGAPRVWAVVGSGPSRGVNSLAHSRLPPASRQRGLPPRPPWHDTRCVPLTPALQPEPTTARRCFTPLRCTIPPSEAQCRRSCTWAPAPRRRLPAGVPP